MSLDPAERRERLVEVYEQARDCTLCPLAETRTNVVFGAGDADADLMFVGEAPGAEEDRRGLPFVGRAGGLLNELLGEIGYERSDVFVANVLKCLRYTAMVQLGDGSWERIGRLVRAKYSGTVRSVSATGEVVERRVVGWHATPLAGRRVYRLSFESAKRNGPNRASVQLTGDHPVLTSRGWVKADDLTADDYIATGVGLSDSEFDLVCGTLLGDGSINRGSTYLSFSHSIKQKAYASFKAQVLSALSPKTDEREVAAVSGGEARYGVIQGRTLASRALRVLRTHFYPAEIKVVPAWIGESLSARMLAIWFCDDGCTRIRGGGRRPLAEIATNAFSDNDREVLLAGLRRLGIEGTAHRRRLYFDVEQTERLSEVIAPFVPEPMRYKLTPRARLAHPFDASRYQSSTPRTLYDRARIEDVTDRVGADKTFFCIDVEGTANFVTAGGVVHNCRPPGNRDPQPEEIASCRPYLERQVELIEPTVIATLGNFATKLLTNSKLGITKVRGTPQLHKLGGRDLFVLPILHPAAALRNPNLNPTMREDFATLRELVDSGPPLIEEPQEAEAEPGSAAPATPATDQMGLFGGDA